MTTYYRCDGTVSTGNDGGSLCSSGWLVVDEPVYSLVSQEQAGDLLAALFLLWGLYMVFKMLLKQFGVI